MNDREKKELIFKILNMYAFAQAFSSVNVENISDIKLNADNNNPELIDIHYRLVEKSSLELSHTHSARMFKTLYNDVQKEFNLLFGK
tara:strand:- start:431 stop:691 length:261 start_codon:yes stop_codon:yes gene_type:complete